MRERRRARQHCTRIAQRGIVSNTVSLLKLPSDFRRAVVHMRQQSFPNYESVEVLFYDEEGDYLVVRTKVTDRAEPREHQLHRYAGSIYKRDVDARLTPGFDVFKTNDTPAALPTKRAIRRRRPVAEVEDLVQASGTTEMWMERRRLQRELESLDYEFIRRPSLAQAGKINELYKKLASINTRLAFASEAADILDMEDT